MDSSETAANLLAAMQSELQRQRVLIIDRHPPARESLRLMLFLHVMQDLRALQLLEKLDGRDAVVALIHQGLDREISMFDYPRDEAWLLNLRHRVNQRIRELSK